MYTGIHNNEPTHSSTVSKNVEVGIECYTICVYFVHACIFCIYKTPRSCTESQGLTKDQLTGRQRFPRSMMKGGIPKNSYLSQWGKEERKPNCIFIQSSIYIFQYGVLDYS